jgi:hypothetical protein
MLHVAYQGNLTGSRPEDLPLQGRYGSAPGKQVDQINHARISRPGMDDGRKGEGAIVLRDCDEAGKIFCSLMALTTPMI